MPLPGGRVCCLLGSPDEVSVFRLPSFIPDWSHPLPMTAAAFACSLDGSHVACAVPGGILGLLDTSGETLHGWFCGSPSPTGLAVAPGGKAVACIAGQFLHFRRMPPGSESNHHRLNKHHFTGIAWHPSGDFFATTKGDGNADFWGRPRGRAAAVVRLGRGSAHGHRLRSVRRPVRGGV